MSPVLLKFSHFSLAFNFYFYEKMCIFVAWEGKKNRTMIHFNIYMDNFTWFLLFKYVSSLWDIGDIPVSPMWGPCGPFSPPIYEIMDSSWNMAGSTSGSWLSAFLHLEVRHHHLQVDFVGASSAQPGGGHMQKRGRRKGTAFLPTLCSWNKSRLSWNYREWGCFVPDEIFKLLNCPVLD